MKRFWEPKLSIWQVCVLPGELYVTREDELLTTVLGSCVSACIRDVKRGLGGINHFLLPRAPAGSDDGATARYGVYALECLVNDTLRGGTGRKALEVKVFGGGRVIEGSGDIGRANIEFVRDFFRREGIAVVAEDVGGAFARRLRYWPRTGRVQVMHMPMLTATDVVADERAAASRLAPASGGVELF